MTNVTGFSFTPGGSRFPAAAAGPGSRMSAAINDTYQQ
jgi:hypothetical protein